MPSEPGTGMASAKTFTSKREFERAMFPRLAEQYESPKQQVDRIGERLIEALRRRASDEGSS